MFSFPFPIMDTALANVGFSSFMSIGYLEIEDDGPYQA